MTTVDMSPLPAIDPETNPLCQVHSNLTTGKDMDMKQWIFLLNTTDNGKDLAPDLFRKLSQAVAEFETETGSRIGQCVLREIQHASELRALLKIE